MSAVSANRVDGLDLSKGFWLRLRRRQIRPVQFGKQDIGKRLEKVSKWGQSLPSENIGDAKDDNTGDDVEEITEGQDTHKLVEVIPLAAEPEDEADIANNTENTNHDLKINMRVENTKYKQAGSGPHTEYKAGESIVRVSYQK